MGLTILRSERVRAVLGIAERATLRGFLAVPLGADGFMVIEKWATKEDLMAHAAAPHMAAYSAKVKDMLAGRVIHVLSAA